MAAAAVSLMAVASGAAPAAASCVGALPGSAATAPAPAPALVFVGTVTATSDQDRTATVYVDEVWIGPRIPPEVIMRGSPDVGAAATSVDRHYHTGHQYLFVPASASGPPYEDNSCTATKDFSAADAANRPGSVIRYPAAPPGPPLIPLGAAVLAGLGAGLYAFLRLRDARTGNRTT